MSRVLDPRIMKIVISVGSTDYIYQDDGSFNNIALAMTAKGCKFANPIQNECTVQIFNLRTSEKNFLLSETSPFNSNAETKTMSVYAGRVSTGFALVFTGDITNSNGGQMPDVPVTLKSATKQSLKCNVIGINRGTQMLSGIAGQVADGMGLQLQCECDDKLIQNYSYSGSQIGEIDKLNNAGNVNAYIDDHTLVVKGRNASLANVAVVVNQNTGMVGIPELTEEGVRVKFLFNNAAVLGGELQLTTTSNPILNGNYTIAKMEFDLANRDVAWYQDATCVNAKLSAYIAANNPDASTQQ